MKDWLLYGLPIAFLSGLCLYLIYRLITAFKEIYFAPPSTEESRKEYYAQYMEPLRCNRPYLYDELIHDTSRYMQVDVADGYAQFLDLTSIRLTYKDDDKIHLHMLVVTVNQNQDDMKVWSYTNAYSTEFDHVEFKVNFCHAYALDGRYLDSYMGGDSMYREYEPHTIGRQIADLVYRIYYYENYGEPNGLIATYLDRPSEENYSVEAIRKDKDRYLKLPYGSYIDRHSLRYIVDDAKQRHIRASDVEIIPYKDKSNDTIHEEVIVTDRLYLYQMNGDKQILRRKLARHTYNEDGTPLNKKILKKELKLLDPTSHDYGVASLVYVLGVKYPYDLDYDLEQGIISKKRFFGYAAILMFLIFIIVRILMEILGISI